jgi:pilus assembly protein CpaD
MPHNPTTPIRLLLLAGMLLVSGCGANAPDQIGWSDPVPLKQNKVEFVNLDYDVHFAPRTNSLSAGEADGLFAFLKQSAVGDGDTVTVAGSGSTLAAQRQAAVMADLRHLHIRAVPAADSTIAFDAVRVRVGHAVVTAPRCPDWSKPEADNATNSPSSNFGCATESSLALMVADPADLVRGKPPGPANGDVLARGIELYKTGGLSKSLASSNGYSSGGLSGASGSSSGGSGGGTGSGGQ